MLVLTIVIASQCKLAMSHSGGLDASGGHHDRKHGGYHFHRAAPNRDLEDRTADRAAVVMEQPTRKLPVRITARTTARTTASSASAMQKELDRSKAVATAGFLFHMTKGLPRPVADFSDNGEFWRVRTPLDGDSNYPKTLVSRIEPTTDLMERRTWIDVTEKFSTVARFIRRENSVAVLRKLSGDELRIGLSKLSEPDRKHIGKIEKTVFAK